MHIRRTIEKEERIEHGIKYITDEEQTAAVTATEGRFQADQANDAKRRLWEKAEGVT